MVVSPKVLWIFVEKICRNPSKGIGLDGGYPCMFKIDENQEKLSEKP